MIAVSDASPYTHSMRVPLILLALALLAPVQLSADAVSDADTLFREAAGEYNQGNPDRAVLLLKQALGLYEEAEEPGRQIEVLNWLGLVEYYRAAYAPAEAWFQQALDLARSAGLPERVPGTLNNLGLVRYAQGRYDEAVALYQSAHDEQVKAGDEESAAQSLGNLASVYLSLSRYPEAETAYRQALESFESVGNEASATNTRINLGLLYTTWARYDAARSELETGLAEAERRGLKQSEAYGLAGLGSVHFATGRYDRAEQAYLKALRLDVELGLRLNELSVTSSLGTVYQAWGRSDKALELYRTALSDAEKLGVPDQAINAMYLIGSALQADGRYDEATAQLTDALARARALGREPAELPILEALGTSSFLKKDADAAEPWFRKAYELAQRLGQANMAARQLIHLGAVNEVAGNRQAALGMYGMALDMVRAAGQTADEAVVLNNIGTVYLETGAYLGAEEKLLQAISIKEELRRTASGQARMDFLATQLSSYRSLVTVRILRGDAAGAFDASDLMKGRWLAEALGGQTNPAAGSGATAFAGIRDVQASLGPKTLIVSYANVDADRPAVLVASRDAVRARELSIAVTPAGAASSEQERAEQAPSRGFVIVRPPQAGTGLADRIRAYRRALTQPDPSAAGRDARRRLGRDLYDLLFGPIQADLEGRDELIVVPDGTLCALPFEALILPDGRYLVERYHVTYVPSIAVRGLLAARRAAVSGGQLAVRQRVGELLALGGAVYGGRTGAPPPMITPRQLDALRLSSEQAAGNSRGAGEIYAALGLDAWEDLPGTRAEVASIGALLPSGSILTGPDASEARIKQMSRDGTLARFSVIHFATHGIAVPEAPELSALVLSQVPGDEDGYLTMREIAGLRLNADFVNLSACDTGMGKILAGEGVVGLSEAFLSAGAGSLSVSLWPVSDEGTQKFMTDLYRMVKERGISYARAMTEVKRQFLKKGRFQEPVYWAAFVFYGS
jgi:CHAT domain-containing protein/tetratricopeptide (TPR) repeat protein